MISNSTPYKLKASKSTRLVNSYKSNHTDEHLDDDSADGDPNHHLDPYWKGIGKARQMEYRSNRPLDRRTAYRGRGGSSAKRSRDYGYSFGSKYHYSPTRHSDASGGYHLKQYDSEKKLGQKLNLPEDTRISKLLRKLSTEVDQENSLAISKKLLEVLLIPDNASYVRKAFHILGDSMCDILCVSPGMAAKEQAARALGRMGYIMAQENDFKRYENWLINNIQNSEDDMRYLFMKSLKETLCFERKTPKLQEYATDLLHDLISTIETVDNSEVFKVTLDNLTTLVELYPENFYAQFSNTIDLLFGWHVDPTQPLANVEFVSKNLQRMSKHFQVNIEFSVTLIWHFIEDIETYSSQLFSKETDENAGSIEQVTVTILALNTVLKCLGEAFHPANNAHVTLKFVTDCMQKILSIVREALEVYVPDNLVIAANDTVSILLGITGTKTAGLNDDIYNLIDAELSLVNDFNQTTVVSLLLMISKVIKELSTDLRLELIGKLIGPQSKIRKLRNSSYINIQETLTYLYQSLLNLKNVPLLQEAYRFVLGDLELVYKKILPDFPITKHITNPFDGQDFEEDAELGALFLLRCLSQLANASGSIIGMWALNPSILELLGVQLQPYSELLATNSPTLQYSLFNLLGSHCRCYNHFVSSSSLVTVKQDKLIPMRQLGVPESLSIVDVATNSPNSGNFAIILDVLCKTMCQNISTETILLLLHWLYDILLNSETYLELFYNNEKFQLIAKELVECGYNFDARIVLAVCDSLQKMLSNKQLSFSNNFLVSVSDLCKLHMTSNNPEISQRYTYLSANIPWEIAIIEFNKIYSLEHVKQKQFNFDQFNNFSVTLGQHLHLSGNFDGEMQPLHFKVFMKYLLGHQEMEGSWLEDLFMMCWPLESDNQNHSEHFRDLAVNNRTILYNWASLEAAEFCVNSKLRTPLGKPNDTFTAIENSLKRLARDLIRIQTKCSDTNQKQVKLLLLFVEHLEKAIYNAYEGSAMAMPQPSKPVRTFFYTNASTCREWLARIRLVVADLALHAGEPSIALRHSQSHLSELLALNKVATAEFERTIIQVVLAYLILNESEPIYGLYVWCKKTGSKKYTWIKYAAEQANRHYESAVLGYKEVLKELKAESVDPYLECFIVDQIINCHKQLNNVTDLMSFHEEIALKADADNGVRYSYNATDWNSIKSLFSIEFGNYAFDELTEWKEPEHTANTWSIFDVQCSVESSLLNVAFNITSLDNVKLCEAIDSNLSKIHGTIQDNLISVPSGFLQNFCLLHYICNGLKNIVNNIPANSVFLVSENFESEVHKIDLALLNKVLWWSEYFAKVQTQGSSIFSNNLRLDIIKKARKEHNFKEASLQLYKFLKTRDLWHDDENGSSASISTISSYLLQKIPEVTVWSADLARAVNEAIKLSYCQEESKQVTFNLCAAASTEISKYAELYGGNDLKVLSSKILLKLAVWLQINDNVPLTDLNTSLGKLLMVLPEISKIESLDSTVIPLNDMAVGKLLHFNVHQCASLAKNWNAFGTWCYRWGRKVVDLSSSSLHSLTEDDKNSIQNLLPPETSQEDVTKIYSILSQTVTVLDEEDIASNEINTSEMIQNQLQNVRALQNAYENQLHALVQIWKNIQKRVYVYYELSAEAYFKYLHLTSSSDGISKSTECNTVTVTLRLLRLIVKHALELQSVLENGLEDTPTHPWKIIIPQLFSRLNHPEAYVRKRVSELLCRVAEDAPHLITFPAVVGALEGGVKFNFSEITLPKDCLSQTHAVQDDVYLNDVYDNFDSDKEDSKNVLQSCFKSMVETLSKQAPETISQVQVLVKELRRITLLWDELWLGTLAQYQSEIIKRQQQLEQEIEKVNENPSLEKEEKISLIAEKHRIIIKPIIFVLEQLNDVTTATPETPHEKQFQERFSSIIKEALDKLKNPEKPEKPQESWQPLKNLQKIFQQKFHKRTSYTLKMQDISPVLAGFKNTVIAMPGLATTAKTRVTITGVSNHVSILPTKTKPKKLVFCGSDGQTHTYLFKGLEDLHLDERIMQFLNIANTMMAQNTNTTENNLYCARHYSVIPLGPRSGLISWVDGTTPIFALYKRWQQRESAKINAKSSNNSTATIPRVSELFYSKLNPLLKEHGVKNLENRKEWPLAILKKVITELMEETPSDLLARELWCYSVNAASYWQVVKKYSYSVAVMSIIGYIIGLGDRHLDNLLIDLSSGEVVHIDYNVCFEKGKTLRVPEKVPFRLTPNLRDALGITGVEGIFRLACEHVLKTMKKGRETLLTLLEAFVYDPLVDWTVGNEVLAGTSFGALGPNTNSRISKKDLEKEVTISMFNVRCTEMKAEWIAVKEALLEESVSLEVNLNTWITLNKVVTETEDNLKDSHQQLALLKEAEAHGANNHHLYSLPSRYESYRKTKEAISTAKKDLENLIGECEMHLQRYNTALKALEGPQYSKWILELSNNPSDQEGFRVFDLVKEFLQNAGQMMMIEQCEQSELEVARLSQQQNSTVKTCLKFLQEYINVLSHCPVSLLENHRMHLILKWSKFLSSSSDLLASDAVYQQYCAFIDMSNSPHIKPIVEFSYRLNLLYSEVATQASKLYEELAKVKTPECTMALEKMYANARRGVSSFLNREKGASKAFQFVIVSELLLLNQNFLTLETAAHRSGDWLIKLTSRDGDWFLDELVLNSNRAAELINNLPVQQNLTSENSSFVKTVSGVKKANNLYRGLQELYLNYHTIILSESIKKIQNEEPSVIQMMTELNNLILNIGTPITELINQLEKIMPCILMQMEIMPTHEYILAQVAEVRSKYTALLQPQNEVLSQGKMLLMGFNGLFDKLTEELDSLINTVGEIEVPLSWRRLDQVKEAKSIAAHIFNPKVKSVLDDIFLLKRINTISEFFTLCVEMCQSFKGMGNLLVFNDEQLAKPVKQFIADFIARQFLGITTKTIAYTICFLLQHLGLDVTNEIEQKDIGAESKVPLDELYQKGFAKFVKHGTFTHNVLAQASSLEANLKSAWEKMQEPKKLEQNYALLQSTASRLQNHLTAHTFVFEDIFRPLMMNTCSFSRSKFVIDLRAEAASLNTVQHKLSEACEQQKTLIASADQRLKWAAGANPDLNEVLSAFEAAVASRDNRLSVEQQIANVILATVNTILQHELLSIQTPEAKALDKVFLNSCEKWRAACQYSTMKLDVVSATEESLMKLFTPDMVTNPKWLPLLSEKVTELINITQKELNSKKEEMFTVDDTLLMSVSNLAKQYSKQTKLINEVKPLLKSLAKTDEFGFQTQKFVTDYREYTEKFAIFVHNFKKDLNAEKINTCLVNLNYIEENTEKIHASFMNIENQNHEDYNKGVEKSAVTKQDGTTKGQQRNAYAVGVWRRVRMKLEGRDPDPGKKSTVQEQVDYVIQEATSLDNLALLYEGWTPWV